MKFQLYILSLLLVFGNISCEETNHIVVPTNENSDLLFTFANPITIPTTTGQANFPIFNISDLPSEYVYIGIFNEEIEVEGNVVKNQDALVWHWDSQNGKVNTVSFDDGTTADNFSITDILCNENETFYWAVWAWDDKGLVIEYSTVVTSFVLEEQNLPALSLVDVALVSEGDNDGFLQRNEDIIYSLKIKNTGSAIAESVSITLKNDLISDFPLTQDYGDIAIGNEKVKTFTFKVPFTAVDKNQLINIQMESNNCIESYDNFSISLVKRPCIDTIYVDYIPDHNLWDLSNFSMPDVYFQIFEGTNTTLFNFSPTNNNVYSSDLPILWFYTTCKELRLDKTYTLDFYDEDDITADQLMSRTFFTLGDKVDTEPTTLNIIDQTGFLGRIKISWHY